MFLKQYCKYLLYRLHLAGWLDVILFHTNRYRNRKQNHSYLQNNPAAILPDDYALYETFQLDYRKFIEEGKLAAEEIIAWSERYLLQEAPKILDWGCGTGRIIRHISSILPNAFLWGCDTNETLIEWNKTHYNGIAFSTITSFAPTLYAPDFFNLIYGFSVLTHIDATRQKDWLQELHRILDSNGIVLITTQGSYYHQQLLPFQKKILNSKGIYTQTYPKQGHRMMSTYHSAPFFKKMIEPLFTVLEHYEGKIHPEKAGGQDVWILGKL